MSPGPTGGGGPEGVWLALHAWAEPAGDVLVVLPWTQLRRVQVSVRTLAFTATVASDDGLSTSRFWLRAETQVVFGQWAAAFATLTARGGGGGSGSPARPSMVMKPPTEDPAGLAISAHAHAHPPATVTAAGASRGGRPRRSAEEWLSRQELNRQEERRQELSRQELSRQEERLASEALARAGSASARRANGADGEQPPGMALGAPWGGGPAHEAAAPADALAPEAAPAVAAASALAGGREEPMEALGGWEGSKADPTSEASQEHVLLESTLYVRRVALKPRQLARITIRRGPRKRREESLTTAHDAFDFPIGPKAEGVRV